MIPEERRGQAIEDCTASLLHLPTGSGLDRGMHTMPAGFGYLALNGVIIRRTGVEGRFGAELFGEGDLLRPCQDQYDSPALALKIGWTVLERTRLAVLDEQFVHRVAAYPELGPAMVE